MNEPTPPVITREQVIAEARRVCAELAKGSPARNIVDACVEELRVKRELANAQRKAGK